jgi:hypothetical protein
MVAMDRSNKVDYVVQRSRLQVLYDKWKPRRIIAEVNSIGSPIIEELQRSHLPVEGFATTATSKKDIVEALALALEKNDIRLLNDPVLMGELQSFQAEKLPGGGTRYAAPLGSHDGCAMALCLACSAISGPLRGRAYGLLQIWKEQAEKIKLETKPRRIIRRGGIVAPSAPITVPITTTLQPIYYAGKASIMPAACPRCSNPNITAYASSWICICGASQNEPAPTPKPVTPPTPEAVEIGHWQKAAAGFMDNAPMKPFRQQPMIAAGPDLCQCGAGLSCFAETWHCNSCGRAGSYVA